MKTLRQAFGIFLALGVCAPGSGMAAPVDLCVFEWEGYISPFAADFEAYAKTKGSDVKLRFAAGPDGKPLYITSANDIFDMVRAEKCDVVTPTNNYFKDSGSKLLQVLAPIDEQDVPNLTGVIENLRKATYAVADGKRYAVPLLGGGYSLAYNADRVKEPPSSWAALADPRFKGRTSLTNAQYEANVYVAAILAGTPPGAIYALDNIDQAKVEGQLKAIAQNNKAFWESNPDVELMAQDLDLITDYGFGVAFANARGQNWKFAETKEPTTVWLDNISLAPSAVATPEKKKAAHLLLDFMLSPQIQAKIADMYGVVVPVPAALDYVSAEKRTTLRVGTNDFYQADLLWQPLDRRTRNSFKIMWDKAVAR